MRWMLLVQVLLIAATVSDIVRQHKALLELALGQGGNTNNESNDKVEAKSEPTPTWSTALSNIMKRWTDGGDSKNDLIKRTIVSPPTPSFPSELVAGTIFDQDDLQFLREVEPTCYVTVENKADYHTEVIESLIVQYPLPWDKLPGCKGVLQGAATTDGAKRVRRPPVVQFDVALAEHHKFKLTEGERDGYAEYFHKYLKGSLRNRTDGVVARIGNLVRYTKYKRDYDAYVGVSCDSSDFRIWLRRTTKTFCVLHGECPDCPPWMLERSCFLTPMFEAPQCHLLPTELPQFDHRPFPVPTVNLCVNGGSGLNTQRDYELLASALARLRPQGVEVTLHQRVDDIPYEFYVHNVSHRVKVNHEPDYIKFHDAISRCHIMLPLIGPNSAGSGYFIYRKLSGSLPVIVAHNVPSVMHEKLEQIYQKYLRAAPVKVYNDTQNSFAVALEAMIDQVRNQESTDLSVS